MKKYLCVFQNPTEIKFLILYTIKAAKRPLTNPQLTYLVIDNTETNHFDLYQGLDFLIKIGYVHTYDNMEGKALYELTKDGEQAAAHFEGRLPLIVREYIAKGVRPMFREEKARRQVTTKVVAVSFDEFSVECKVCDDDMPLMTLSLYTGTQEAAMAVQRRFKDNTREIYQRIVELLMMDEPLGEQRGEVDALDQSEPAQETAAEEEIDSNQINLLQSELEYQLIENGQTAEAEKVE